MDKSDADSRAPTVLATRPATPLSEPHEVDTERTPLEDHGFEDRYGMRAVLGVGGMGEVRLYKDRRIGREIAMKIALKGQGSRSGARARFEREARVQGQLEHPAIVPVYDIGMGPDGPYFSMKRVRGKTLDDVIGELRSDAPEAAAHFTQRRLLDAFVRVCLAVEFAHTRGALHRDLKPDNVMLGDFGEVYLLDWGLAKIAGVPDSKNEAGIDPGESSGEARTEVGIMMGTAGYMPPEQVRGEGVDERSDVYALGAILFELLTLEPLHPRGEAALVYAATLAGANARATERAPSRKVPPELEAVCVKATATSPADRYASARQLAEAVEGYLDGHRDRVRRRELATEHVQDARGELGRLARGGAGAEGARVVGLRKAIAAMALDPSSMEAKETVLGLVMHVPSEVPAEARDELARTRSAADQAARNGPFLFLSFCLALEPVFFLFGPRGSGGLWALIALMAATAVGLVALRDKRDGVRLLVHVAAAVFIGFSSVLMGPLVLTPQLAAANAHSFTHGCPKSQRRLSLVLCVGSVVVPVLLVVLGVVPSPYEFRDGAMVILPQAISLPRGWTLVFLTLVAAVLVIVPSLAVAREHDLRKAAEEREFYWTWSLRRILVDVARM
jgi:eukaryotic-like serine/threonine-protein kinase